MIITMRFTCGYLPLTANVSTNVCTCEISKIKNLAVQRMLRNPTITVMSTSKICQKKNKLRSYVYYHKRLYKIRRNKNVEVVKEVELSSNLSRTLVEHKISTFRFLTGFDGWWNRLCENSSNR
jgi:hypothetical protein